MTDVVQFPRRRSDLRGQILIADSLIAAAESMVERCPAHVADRCAERLERMRAQREELVRRADNLETNTRE